MTPRGVAVVLLLAAGLAAGCGSSPTSPTGGPRPGPRTGTWTGTLTDAVNGRSSLRIALQETAVGDVGLLGGTWTATFASGATAGGEVTGTITGSSVQVTLRRAVPTTCPNQTGIPLLNGAFIAASLTLAEPVITGPYGYQTCDLPVPGTLEVRRQ